MKKRWLARLKANCYPLESKEFYKNGHWVKDEALEQKLNDCIMDFGDSSCFDYDEVSYEEALIFIKRQMA